jgi:hypothetical protein
MTTEPYTSFTLFATNKTAKGNARNTPVHLAHTGN